MSTYRATDKPIDSETYEIGSDKGCYVSQADNADTPGSPQGVVDDTERLKTESLPSGEKCQKGDRQRRWRQNQRRAKEEAKRGKVQASKDRAAALISEALESIPASMAANPLIRRSVERLVRWQTILDERMDAAQGDTKLGRSLDGLVRVSRAIQDATRDLVSAWPRTEGVQRQRVIPRDVMSWLKNIEEFEGPAVVREADGTIVPMTNEESNGKQ